MQEQRKYEPKPLEGVLWLEERQCKTKDGRDFSVCKGKLLDERGKEFYIDGYVNYTKHDGKKYLSLKLKSVEEVDREKEARGYAPRQQQSNQSQSYENDINVESIPF